MPWFDMINEVKDVNSILNKWLWLSCNLFLYSFFHCTSMLRFLQWHACSQNINKMLLYMGLKECFFFFIFSHVLFEKPLFLQKTIQNWAWDIYVYLSMNILIVCSSFRKGKSQFVLTLWTACKSLGQCQWAHDKYE